MQGEWTCKCPSTFAMALSLAGPTTLKIIELKVSSSLTAPLSSRSDICSAQRRIIATYAMHNSNLVHSSVLLSCCDNVWVNVSVLAEDTFLHQVYHEYKWKKLSCINKFMQSMLCSSGFIHLSMN